MLMGQAASGEDNDCEGVVYAPPEGGWPLESAPVDRRPGLLLNGYVFFIPAKGADADENGRADGIDKLIARLDQGYEDGYRRFVINRPYNYYRGERAPTRDWGRPFSSLLPWAQEGLLNDLPAWIEAHPDVMVEVYVLRAHFGWMVYPGLGGIQNFDITSACQVEAFAQELQTFADCGFSRVYFDAANEALTPIQQLNSSPFSPYQYGKQVWLGAESLVPDFPEMAAQRLTIPMVTHSRNGNLAKFFYPDDDGPAKRLRDAVWAPDSADPIIWWGEGDVVAGKTVMGSRDENLVRIPTHTIFDVSQMADNGWAFWLDVIRDEGLEGQWIRRICEFGVVEKPADVNGDGGVDIFDVVAFLESFMASVEDNREPKFVHGDYDRDEMYSVGDVITFLNDYVVGGGDPIDFGGWKPE